MILYKVDPIERSTQSKLRYNELSLLNKQEDPMDEQDTGIGLSPVQEFELEKLKRAAKKMGKEELENTLANMFKLYMCQINANKLIVKGRI